VPDIFLDVDTALAEVPVNILPLTDSTDFVTRETAVAHNAAGMDLVWNFVSSAGSFTQTAVTPTSGGDYDWSHQGDGMYTIEIPASGGASINNDSEGYGWFTGIATGVLAWRGPILGFRASGLNDLLLDNAYSTTRGLAGTALPNAVAEASGGLYTRGTGAGQINQDSNGRIDGNLVAWRGTQPNTLTSGRVEVLVGAVTNGIIAAASFASGALDAVWSTTTRLLTAGTNIALAKGTGVTGFNDLDAAGVRGAVGLASANLDTQLSTIDDFLDTEIAAIKAKTDNLPSDPADASDIASAFSTVNGKLDTIDDFLDTEVAAILAAVDTEVAAIKAKTDNLPDGLQKNTALNNYMFVMVDSADHITGKTGLTVTAERSIDGGSFAACANSPSEVGSGVYKLNLASTDLNGDVITLKFSATGADTTLVTHKTES
jgi:hypothetical protein